MSYHRRAISCDLCGQQFFPSSLPFHMKQCLVKQQFVEVPCPYCDQAVRNSEMDRHLAKGCNKVGSSSSKPQRPVSGGQVGMRPCAVCGRRFAVDRLLKHQTICRRNSEQENQRRRESSSNSPPPHAQAINSNWRDKRDEMKRQMKNSKARNNVEFELVMKDTKKEPQLSNEAMVIIHHKDENIPVTQLLDDSLDAVDASKQDFHGASDAPSTSVSESDSKPTAWRIDWTPLVTARPKNIVKVKPEKSSPVQKPAARWIESGPYKGMAISQSFYAPKLDLTSRLPQLANLSSSRIRFN